MFPYSIPLGCFFALFYKRCCIARRSPSFVSITIPRGTWTKVSLSDHPQLSSLVRKGVSTAIPHARDPRELCDMITNILSATCELNSLFTVSTQAYHCQYRKRKRKTKRTVDCHHRRRGAAWITRCLRGEMSESTTPWAGPRPGRSDRQMMH